jgi:hypothetical protein
MRASDGGVKKFCGANRNVGTGDTGCPRSCGGEAQDVDVNACGPCVPDCGLDGIEPVEVPQSVPHVFQLVEELSWDLVDLLAKAA